MASSKAHVKELTDAMWAAHSLAITALDNKVDVATMDKIRRLTCHVAAGGNLSTCNVTKTVRNLQSGKEIEIPIDTPLSCDPSSETYWSM